MNNCPPTPPTRLQPSPFLRFAERHRRLVNLLLHHNQNLLTGGVGFGGGGQGVQGLVERLGVGVCPP